MGLDLIKNNFSSGEINPVLNTRTEVSLYQNGAKTLENVIPLVEGGVKKRSGTNLLKTGTPTDFVRLITFAPVAKQPYILLLGINKIQVVNALTWEIVQTLTTTYSTAEIINDIQFANSAYTMYLTHPDYAPRILKTDKDFSTWSISTMLFDVPPMSSNPEARNASLTPDGKDVGATVTLRASNYAGWSETSQYFKGDRVSYNGKTWEAEQDNVNKPPEDGEDWLEVSAGGAVFTIEDVGSIVSINSGLIRVTTFIDGFAVRGTVLKKLEATIQAIALSWTISKGAFSADNGYPRCIIFYKQRLVFANTASQPNTVWFSRVGAFGNFLETTDDGDAFSVAPASDRSDSINYLVQTSGGIAALTGTAEFFIRSSAGAISPTSVEIKDDSFFGAFADFRPVRAGKEVLFNQRGGMRIRALTYRYEVDGLDSSDISISSKHIPVDHGSYIDAAYQQEPNSIIWMILEDFTVASLTLNREQDVVSWARHHTKGDIISLESIPTFSGYDRMVFLVDREGVVHLEEISEDAMMDSSVVRVGNTSSQISLGGELNWLSKDDMRAFYKEGDAYTQIKILDFDQDTGLLTMSDDDYNGKDIHVGAAINCKVELLPPDISQSPQSMRDSKIAIQRITASLYKTLSITVNGVEKTLKKPKDNPLTSRVPITGDVVISEHGWSDLVDFKLSIEHDYPSPFHLQAIVMKVEINSK